MLNLLVFYVLSNRSLAFDMNIDRTTYERLVLCLEIQSAQTLCFCPIRRHIIVARNTSNCTYIYTYRNTEILKDIFIQGEITSYFNKIQVITINIYLNTLYYAFVVVLKDTNSRTLTIQRFGSEAVLSFTLFLSQKQGFQ